MKKLKIILNRIIFLIIMIFVVLFIIEENANIREFLGINSEIEKSEENVLQNKNIDQNENPKAEKIEIDTSIASKIDIDENMLNIIFFDVGQADSTLVLCDGQTVLIDAGNTYDGKKIVDGIRDLGIEKIDYLIGTHVHEDHLGGMSYVIDNFDIGSFYMPTCTENEFSFYSRLISSLSYKNIPINKTEIGEEFILGKGKLEVMGVNNNEPENINESSIILELSYCSQKYLFMADAEIINEESRIWNDVDVLKVGHHGSNSSTSQEFLNQVLPEISIISVGKVNDYELPNQDVIDRLEEIESTIYRTDLDGTIQIISNGEKNDVVKIDVSFDGY